MRNQQEAERAEQQRIKNLVLNYDLTDDQQDGIEEPAFHYIMSPDKKRTRLVGKGSLNKSLRTAGYTSGQSQRSTSYNDDEDGEEQDKKISGPFSSLFVNDVNAKQTLADQTGAFDTLHGQPRVDKSGNTRSKQRARKLQLGDIDWYDNSSRTTNPDPPAAPQTSLDDYVVDKKQPKQSTSSRRRTAGRGNRAAT